MPKATKKPHGRPAGRTFTRATREVIEQRTEEVARMLVRQATRFEIHKAVCEKWGITWQAVDATYISYARKLLARQANMSQSEARTLGISTLLAVLRTGTNRERIAAEDRLAEIFGYNAPRQTVLSGKIEVETEARPLKDVPPNRLREIAAFAEN